MGIADNYVRFTLRIPEEMRETLQKISKKNHRSLNSEILSILQKECDRHQQKVQLKD